MASRPHDLLTGCPFLLVSEPDFELCVEAMLACIACQLSLIGDAEGCGFGEVEVEAGFEEGSVFCDRHAGDDERIRAGEGMGGERRGVAKGMLPAERAMRGSL